MAVGITLEGIRRRDEREEADHPSMERHGMDSSAQAAIAYPTPIWV
jgi:hypothetical protein